LLRRIFDPAGLMMNPAASPPETKPVESSDRALLELLNQSGALGIGELAAAMRVTATAVRQRLARLMGQGLIGREATRERRGRPSHRYSLTRQGRRERGSNFGDLTLALWKEVREIKEPEIRAGLLQRLARRMAEMYAGQVHGANLAERMQAVSELFGERQVKFQVEERAGQLPVLTALSCPYPDLAEQDRAICVLEKALFSELLGTSVRLTDCRLDGDRCCRFESN
jgi:predicted ArsR family transcriptional regulator